MNRHALDVLEFRDVLEQVAARAAGPLGAAAVRSLTPSDSAAWIAQELRRVEQMMAWLQADPTWAMPAVPDLRAELRRLRVDGAVLEPAELRHVGALLQASASTREAIQERAEQLDLLTGLASALVVLAPESRAIERAIDESGAVRDDASPELARLRREIRGARSRVVQELESYMAMLPERFRVADGSVSLREGRYVIPVRREGRSHVGGIVHDESATGQTLYMEPPVAIELMNRLRELERAEAREVLRILRSLTDRLRPHADALSSTLDALVALDSLYARARYALDTQGTAPEMSPPESRDYRVVGGRHPLLVGGQGTVVPFDLELSGDERTLLVSGPNTGGKTVLLKAIGLISLLSQAGVVPPVGPGTRLPVFADVFADIGDEQSIEASLSTFSAHLRNLREILEHADHRSLVLIDEIGSGTDPVEGAALARAVLIELTARGAFTVATTHLGELKRLSAEAPGVVNASLQFDAAELRPTYRLKKGVPGRSYGLAIARRLGFPETVLATAEAAVPESDRRAAAYLAELEEKDRRLEAALAEAEEARAAAQALRADLEARTAELERRQKTAEREARAEARRILLEARSEVESVIRELREAASEATSSEALDDAIRRARRRVERAVRESARSGTPEAPERDIAAGTVAVGSHVRVAATGAVGTVTEIREGRATVETDGIRLSVPLAGLTVVSAPLERPRRTVAWTAPEVEASPEVDLRGLRADEAVARLEPAIDAAHRSGLASLRIIHGKGTGALRAVVAEHLQSDPRVRSFRAGGPGEGGTGVTVAEL